LDSSIVLNPNFPKAIFNRGQAKYRLKDYSGALNDFNRVIYLDPFNAHAYMKRGMSYLGLGDKDNACIDWNKAADLGWKDVYEYIRDYCR